MNPQIKMMAILNETLLEAIPEQGIPSGHIYAQLSGIMTLHMYMELLIALEEEGALKQKGHYLTRGLKYEELLGAMKKAQNC